MRAAALVALLAPLVATAVAQDGESGDDGGGSESAAPMAPLSSLYPQLPNPANSWRWRPLDGYAPDVFQPGQWRQRWYPTPPPDPPAAEPVPDSLLGPPEDLRDYSKDQDVEDTGRRLDPPQFSYVTYIEPNSGPVRGGTRVNITGSALAFTPDDEIAVTVAGVRCDDVTILEPRLECQRLTMNAIERGAQGIFPDEVERLEHCYAGWKPPLPEAALDEAGSEAAAAGAADGEGNAALAGGAEEEDEGEHAEVGSGGIAGDDPAKISPERVTKLQDQRRLWVTKLQCVTGDARPVNGGMGSVVVHSKYFGAIRATREGTTYYYKPPVERG